MEERWLWYLAGAVDTAGLIDVSINKEDKFIVGYGIEPKISLSRTYEFEIIFGMLDEFCEEHDVHYTINDNGGKNATFQITKHTDVKNFLEPLIPRLVQQRKSGQILVEDIVPLLEQGKHNSEKGFMEIMVEIEKMRSHTSRSNLDYEYSKSYFDDHFSS